MMNREFLKKTFLTQIHADCPSRSPRLRIGEAGLWLAEADTQIYADICDYLRFLPAGQAGIGEKLRLKCFFKSLTQILILATCYSLLATFVYAQPISSTDLIDKAKEYDGKIISYKGEVIGDIMPRGDYAWVNVNDGYAAIGIWAPRDLINNIVFKGSYKFQGDFIEAKGIFNRSCIEHGGDLDIHVSSMRKLKDGFRIEEQTNSLEKRIALLFLGLTLCLGILQILRRKR